MRYNEVVWKYRLNFKKPPLKTVKPFRKVFVNFVSIMDLELDSIMERLEAKSFYFSVVGTKVLKI